MKANKKNILFFSPQRCTGCILCEMRCSLQQTHGECNRTATSIKVSTHPTLYSSVILHSMGCNCPDGMEKCVEVCNQDAIVFVKEEESPGMLCREGWIPSPVVSPGTR